jgi:glycosyltransferase involved in cell wall biosynthesis
MSRLSIVTAVHNGLPMNKLYWKALHSNTQAPFELILIDNHSTDGSEKFFEELSHQTLESHHQVVYIRNEFNQSYPASQLQGMRYAKNEVLCFFNNDIWMPKGWEKNFLLKLKENPLLILSPSGQEAQPTQRQSNHLKAKWKRNLLISQLWMKCFRKSEEQRLWKALELMYGSLENFQSPTLAKTESINGIKGDSVICHRDLPLRLGTLWDKEIEAADWHLYLKAAALNEIDPSFPLPQVLLDVYVHHFGRYSAKQEYEPHKEKIRFKTIDEVWGKETVNRLWWGLKLAP